MPSRHDFIDWKNDLHECRIEMGGNKFNSLEEWFTEYYPLMTNTELMHEMRQFGVEATFGAVDGKAKRLRLRKRSDTMQRANQHARIVVKSEIPALSSEDVFNELLRRRDWYKQHHPLNVEHTIEFDDQRPIALVGTGDWHVGAEGVDYRRLKETLELASAYEGVYFLGTGDYYDNYKPNHGAHSSGIYNALISQPDFQELGAKYFLELLTGRILAMVAGCHLRWDYESAGRTVLDELARGVGALPFGHGGCLNITFTEGASYRVILRHRYAGTAASASRKIFDEYPVDECDVAFLGHFHFNEVAEFERRDRQRVFLRTGGWKEDDEYGQKIAGYSGSPGMPMCILWPNKHKVVPFIGAHLQEGLDLLRLLRAHD